jgi:formate hydrogenlyase subunit 3/multisubunit Na+/H+ antiporter MnhD subunit
LSDPFLLLLLCLIVAVLLLGAIGAVRPDRGLPRAAAILCGGGAVLTALMLLFRADPAALSQAVALPPLTSRVLADAVNLPFLFALLLSGAIMLAVTPSWPRALTVGGLALAILGDGVVPIGVGLTVASLGLWRAALDDRPSQRLPSSLIPSPLVPSLLVLAVPAVMLWFGIAAPTTAAAMGPGFAAIRAAPADGLRAAFSAGLALAAAAAVLAPVWRPPAGSGPERDLAIPAALYLLTRLLIDLPGPMTQAWWGFALLLTGAATAVIQGWRAAGAPALADGIGSLVRLHAGLAIAALGACVIARAADLPEAAAFGLSAAMLAVLGTMPTGIIATAMAALIADSAGTDRLARLGALIQTMPVGATIMAAALLGLAAVPPGTGFASLWLLFETLLHTPRTGGLFAQIPIALTAACASAAFALAAASAFRIAGIALLGRPRTARAAGAVEIRRMPMVVLATATALATVMGLLPGLTLRALAHPLIIGLTGVDLDTRLRWASLSATATSPGYATLPILALVLLVTGGVILSTRRYRAATRRSTVWTDGQPASPALPFGDPMAQSAGTGFRPALPKVFPAALIRFPPRPSARAEYAEDRSSPLASSQRSGRRVRLPSARRLSARGGLWAMLLSLSVLLLATAVLGPSGP